MLCRGFTFWVQAAILLATVNAQLESQIDTESKSTTVSHRRHSQYNIYYARQLMSTSSSYDYWWPYPPADATTNPTTTLVSDTPTDTLWISGPTSLPALAISFATDSAFSSLSYDTLSSASLTSAPSALPSSSSASQQVISITALPPANSSIPSTSHRKLAMRPPNNLIFVLPISGLGGLLLGGITTWCIYGCFTRGKRGGRRRGRTSYGSLEVGPEYTPPSPQPGEKYESEEGQWVGDEKHDHPPHEDEDASDAEDDQPVAETANFLHPTSAHTQNRLTRDKSAKSTTRAKSHRSTRAPSPTPSGRTSLFFDRAGSPTGIDALPWESLRHKSIKRGILERLQDDGKQEDKARGVARRSWRKHGRNDSDLQVADAARADLERTATTASRTTAGVSRASTTRTGAGFRIESEEPGETPGSERGGDQDYSWPSVEDKYTRVPTRRRSQSPEKRSQQSRSGSPTKAARARGMSPDKPRNGRRPNNDAAAIRDILPTSPPRISSPLLDDALCFTSPFPPPEGTPEIRSFASFGGQA